MYKVIYAIDGEKLILGRYGNKKQAEKRLKKELSRRVYEENELVYIAYE